MKTFTPLKSVCSITCLATMLVCGSASAVTTQIYQENFEDDSNISNGFSPTASDRGYTAGTEYNDINVGSGTGGDDYWYRADTTAPEYNAFAGSGDFNHKVNSAGIEGIAYWAAEDLDNAVPGDSGGPTERELRIEGIDISGQTGLELLFLAAADDTALSPHFENSDFFAVSYIIDSGSETTLFDFRTATDPSITLSLDTNLDGIGDSTALSTTFQEFSTSISGTGSTLDLIFTVSVNSVAEEIGFDNIRINADVVPEPSSTALLGLASLGLLARRKR